MNGMRKQGNDSQVLQRLIAGVSFQPENIVEAATHQAELHMLAAEYRVNKWRTRAAAEAVYEDARATKSLSIRAEATAAGDKVTEGIVAAKLQQSPRVRAALAALENARAEEEYARLLLEVYRMRRDCLRVVAELTSIEAAVAKTMAAGAVERDKLTRLVARKYKDDTG